MKKNNIIPEKQTTRLKDSLPLCILPFAMMILLRSFKLNNEADVKIIMRMMLAGTAMYGGWLAYKGRLTPEKAVFMLLFSGIVMRTGYTIYTHAFTRVYDIGMNNDTGTGHWGYLNHIMKGELPPSNEYQFYQPPFYYILSSVFIRIAMLIRHNNVWSDFMYVAQTVSCTASCVGLVMFVGIMDKFKIDKRVQMIPAALTAFYPVHILSAGRLNNDSTVFMFMVLSLYFTLLWAKDQKPGYIIGIALSIGFGMMTKINCGITALITGPVMLYCLWRRIKERKGVKELIVQLAVFAVIVFPLGLWYPIRNYILFDQPLNFVHILGENSHVYTGDASWAARWLIIPFADFIKTPYMNMGTDTSIWMTVIKTGVHGEFSYDDMSAFLGWSIEYVHTLLLIINIIAVAFIMIKDRETDIGVKYSCFAVWCIMTVSFIFFNISYPYSCSADFRYILIWQLASAVFIGYFTDICLRRRKNVKYKYCFNCCIAVTVCFCVMSIMHFC